MTHSLKDIDTSELEKNKLEGKHNFIQWRNALEAVLVVTDTMAIFNGEVEIESEPLESDFVVYDTGNALTFEPKIDLQLSIYNFKAAHRKWEKRCDLFRLGMEILRKSLATVIVAEIRNYRSPYEACRWLFHVYGFSNEAARAVLLKDVSNLKLSTCDSMIEYIHQHRRLAMDIRNVGQVYDDF